MSAEEQVSKEVGQKASRRAGLAIVAVIAGFAALLVLDSGRIYEWVKALHVIAVISWMAGMVYLPRLFVYHTDAEVGSVQSETFKVMEQRLLKVIITPAMAVTWLAGLWLAWYGGHLLELWFIIKFAMVFVLSGVHGFFAKSVRLFAQDLNQKTAAQWRLYNEVPAVLMILIVIMVIVKPF